MQLSSPSDIKNLLKKHGIWAKKSLGQHFLIDEDILEKIVEASNLTKDDTVLEIGPGLGVLTKELAKRVKKVIAVEIDAEIVKILKESLGNAKNVDVIQGDILKTPISYNNEIELKSYKIVANIPYQITAPLLEKFLADEKNKPKEMILLVQKEVAQKICSKPNFENRLSLFVKLYGTPKIVFFVSKNSFWPMPEVDSAVIKIETSRKPKVKNPKLLLSLVKRGFSQKRKQLKNIFGEEILKNAGIEPTKRAEKLTLEDWQLLAEKFS